MNTVNRKKSPVVRLPPKSDLELGLARAAQVAVIFLGFLGVLFALKAGRFLLAPVTLAVIVGLMLDPVALPLERRGLRPSLSAAVAVLIFVLVLSAVAAAIAAPLASWAQQLPLIWDQLQLQLASFSEPIATIRALQEEIRSVTGNSNVTVAVDDSSAVENVATLAPTLLAQLLIFFASLYFFIATRHQTRKAILKLFTGRRLRWRIAHIFHDVEYLVSRYLLSITTINTGLAVAVGSAMWLIGVPSAPLWGALAGVLNFIMYIGPALTAVALFGVGLASFDTFSGALLPPAVYLVLNGIEAQFVTPTVIGRRMTLNPFLVFLAIAFWLWLWGPIGGFIAIPALLIVFAAACNIFPDFAWSPTEETRRRYSRLP